MPADGAEEPFVLADGDRDPVQPDRPFDPAQHEVVSWPHQVNTRRHDAVAGRAGSSPEAGNVTAVVEELADLLGQPRMWCGLEGGVTSSRAAQELGGQQYLVGHVPEREGCGSSVRGPEQVPEPEASSLHPPAVEHADAKLVDELDQGEHRNATQER